MARAPHARAVPRAASGRHRAGVERRVRARSFRRHLPLRRVRGGALRLDDEVRVGQRVAQLLRAEGPGSGRADPGPQPRNGEDGGPVRPLRIAPRPRVRRRTGTDRPAILHEQPRSGSRTGRRRQLSGWTRRVRPMEIRSDRRYRFDVERTRLWREIAELGHYTEWWPWLRRFDANEL